MTHYFDEKTARIHEFRTAKRDAWEVLPDLEGEVVFDCTVAAMLPGFPPECREAVHRVVLKNAVSTMPVNAPDVDFEHDWEHYRRIENLISDLHTVFHDVARVLGPGYDEPRVGIRTIYTQGEEERERIVVAEHGPAKAVRLWLGCYSKKVLDWPDGSFHSVGFEYGGGDPEDLRAEFERKYPNWQFDWYEHEVNGVEGVTWVIKKRDPLPGVRTLDDLVALTKDHEPASGVFATSDPFHEHVLIPPDPTPEGCTPALNGCTCSCHVVPGTVHIMACCPGEES